MNTVNKATIDLIKSFEGFSAKAYHDSIDPPNVDTIGFGSITYENGTHVKVGDPDITEARAVELLMWEVNDKAKQLAPLITAKLTDNQFGALLSFSYEEGISAFDGSTLHQKVNTNPHDPSIQVEFDKWVYADHKKVAGIERRRKAEWALYNTK